MNYTKTYEVYYKETLPVSSERTFPATPFPSRYIHCAIDDLQFMVQTILALRADGFDPGAIHVMSCWDYADAVERREQQKNPLSRVFTRLLSFLDEGFSDVYLREALRGHHILMVRLSSDEQIERARALLASHYAHHIKYVDTWTVADLASSPEWLSSGGF
jgi:hypothetical protein